MDDNSRQTRRSLLAAASTTAVGLAGCAQITTPADLALRTDPGHHVEYFVGVDWARERRGDLVVLDARQERLFREARIYGARRVPFEGITARRETDEGIEPDTDTIAETVGELGLDEESDVLVYGDSVGARVTRTVFALHAIGHEGEVHILNGGFDAWTGRVGTGTAPSPTAITYDATPDSSRWVTREWVADHLEQSSDAPEIGIVDVRVPEAYIAATGSPDLDPDHERPGHIPGAVNVHWWGNIDRGSLNDPGELYQLYSRQAELSEDHSIVVYGDDNVEPTQTWATLRAIGFSDVRIYEGGYGDWSNVDGDRGRYPVETGTQAVIDTDGQVGTGDGGDFTCS